MMNDEKTLFMIIGVWLTISTYKLKFKIKYLKIQTGKQSFKAHVSGIIQLIRIVK